jgi:hypothetical protein
MRLPAVCLDHGPRPPQIKNRTPASGRSWSELPGSRGGGRLTYAQSGQRAFAWLVSEERPVASVRSLIWGDPCRQESGGRPNLGALRRLGPPAVPAGVQPQSKERALAAGRGTRERDARDVCRRACPRPRPDAWAGSTKAPTGISQGGSIGASPSAFARPSAGAHPPDPRRGGIAGTRPRRPPA